MPPYVQAAIERETMRIYLGLGDELNRIRQMDKQRSARSACFVISFFDIKGRVRVRRLFQMLLRKKQ